MKRACRSAFDSLDDNLVLCILRHLPDPFDRRAWRLSCKRFLSLEATCRTRLHPVSVEALSHLLRRVAFVQHLDLSYSRGVTDGGLRTIARMCGRQLLSLNLSQLWTFSDAGLNAVAQGCSSLMHLDLSLCIQITDIGVTIIGQIKSLRSLKLDQCDAVTDCGLTALVGTNKSLKCLSLRWCSGITNKSIQAVSEFCKGLLELDLSYTEITNRGLESVAKLGLLRKLSLISCHGIDDDSLIHFRMGGKFLQVLHVSRCPTVSHRCIEGFLNSVSLQELSFSYCGSITNTMLQSLHIFHGLQVLKFDGCDVSAADLGIIGKWCGNLIELSLCICQGVTDLMLSALVAGCTKLEKLDLTCCQEVTDIGLSRIATSCTSLHVLKMESCCKLSENGLKELSKLFHSLEELDLTNCGINDLGLECLAQCFNLKVLKMGVCSLVHDRGLSYIALTCCSLSVLDLYRCEEMKDAGIIAICDGCPRLKSLNISYCHLVTDASLVAIAQLRLLTILEMRGCALVSPVGLLVVANACKRLTELDIKYCTSLGELIPLTLAMCCENLKEINLSYCSATDEGIVALAQLNCMLTMRLIHVRNVTPGGVTQVLWKGRSLKKVKLPFELKCLVQQEILEQVELRGCRIKWVNKRSS